MAAFYSRRRAKGKRATNACTASPYFENTVAHQRLTLTLWFRKQRAACRGAQRAALRNADALRDALSEIFTLQPCVMWTTTAQCIVTFIATHSIQSALSRDGEKANEKTGVEKFYTFAAWRALAA